MCLSCDFPFPPLFTVLLLSCSTSFPPLLRFFSCDTGACIFRRFIYRYTLLFPLLRCHYLLSCFCLCTPRPRFASSLFPFTPPSHDLMPGHFRFGNWPYSYFFPWRLPSVDPAYSPPAVNCTPIPHRPSAFVLLLSSASSRCSVRGHRACYLAFSLLVPPPPFFPPCHFSVIVVMKNDSCAVSTPFPPCSSSLFSLEHPDSPNADFPSRLA